MKVKFAENIRSLRKDHGLTQEQLAEVVGVSMGAVSKWELGLSAPELSVIMELAAFFGTSVDVLLGYQLQDSSREAFLEQIKNYIHNKSLSVPFEELERSLLKYPNDFQVVYRCATLYEVRGTESHRRSHHLRAIDLYEQACRLIDQNTDEQITLTAVRCRIADVYRLLDNTEAAIRILKQNNPCGVNNAKLGQILAQLDRAEEALPYLSYGMLDHISGVFMLATGFMNAFMQQKRYQDTIRVVDWMETVLEASFLPEKCNYTHKLLPAFFAAKAHAQLLMDRKGEAKATLTRARDLAVRFDAEPDYSASPMLFAVPDAATAYDDYGTTAMAGLDWMVDEQKAPAFTALWREVQRQ